MRWRAGAVCRDARVHNALKGKLPLGRNAAMPKPSHDAKFANCVDEAEKYCPGQVRRGGTSLPRDPQADMQRSLIHMDVPIPEASDCLSQSFRKPRLAHSLCPPGDIVRSAEGRQLSEVGYAQRRFEVT